MSPASATALLLVAIVVAVGMIAAHASGARAGSDAAGLKAVIIVGPASSSTEEYLDEGERIARQAEAQGMDVRRVFTPHATWARVRGAIQGAKLVVYLGHGNGWPSPMGPFRGESKDGFGLNPCDGECGRSGPTKYYGEDFIRDKVRLGADAVVLLHRLCYSAGNGEGYMPPVFDRDLATRRVSNFASGFLDAGAGVVFALGWRQSMNLPQLLATTDRTMDQIFETPATDGWYDGFVGWDDYYRDSTRTRGARVHLDPHKRYGHLRAITGDLDLTASSWRGEAQPIDATPPTLRIKGIGTTDGGRIAGADKTLVFSPDGDGVDDQMLVQRSLSETATIDLEVRDAAGAVLRTAQQRAERGVGRTLWDGRATDGRVVPDGRYAIRLTPRDRAGNVGETATAEAVVLTVLPRPRLTADGIHARDGDRLAATVGIGSRLRTDAAVTIRIRHGDEVVRTGLDGASLKAGPLRWRWDGRGDDGTFVADGHYVAVVSARTELGTLRYELPVQVGDWTLRVDHRIVRRGQKVSIVARSLEPLAAGATLHIDQPGLSPRIIRMDRTNSHTLKATFKVAKRGPAGRIDLRVVARDRGGQEETDRASIRLR